ncbi:hypothetical protein Avbf_16064 [Armadillidium vulgare]|nr:hypothetical protein Avbf_16064 [Armadillidium vulgare]
MTIMALSIGFQRNIYSRSYSKIYIPEDDSLPFFIIITGIIIKHRRPNSSTLNQKKSKGSCHETLVSLPD